MGKQESSGHSGLKLCVVRTSSPLVGKTYMKLGAAAVGKMGHSHILMGKANLYCIIKSYVC